MWADLLQIKNAFPLDSNSRFCWSPAFEALISRIWLARTPPSIDLAGAPTHSDKLEFYSVTGWSVLHSSSVISTERLLLSGDKKYKLLGYLLSLWTKGWEGANWRNEATVTGSNLQQGYGQFMFKASIVRYWLLSSQRTSTIGSSATSRVGQLIVLPPTAYVVCNLRWQRPRQLRTGEDDFTDALILEAGPMGSFDGMTKKYAREVKKSCFG